MLKIMREEEAEQSGKVIIHDVESAFCQLRLSNDDVTKQLLKSIEKASILDSERVIDRFGTAMYISEISTGCKAALCAYYLSNCIIDTIECGENARDAIVNFLNDGSIIFYYDDAEIGRMNDSGIIDVECDGINVKSIRELNRYLEEEW